MNRKEFIYELAKLPFDPAQYWVVAGGAMILYGFRDETTDIDLGCTSSLANQLQHDGYLTIILDDGSRKIRYSDNIELFENWIIGSVVTVENIPVVSVDGLIKMKEALGREKDLRDIELIYTSLSRK